MTGQGRHGDGELLLWLRLSPAGVAEVLEGLDAVGGEEAALARARIAAAAEVAPWVPAEPPSGECPTVVRTLRIVR